MYRLLRELWKYLFKNKSKNKKTGSPPLCVQIYWWLPPPRLSWTWRGPPLIIILASPPPGIGNEWSLIITQLNRRFSHAPYLIREVSALRWEVWINQIQQFQIIYDFVESATKQSKIRLRFNIWFRSRISHVPNIMH